MLLTLRGTCAYGRRVLFAHVGTLLEIAVILMAGEMVDFRIQVHVNDGVSWAVAFGLRLSGELIRASRRGRSLPRRGGWCGRGSLLRWSSRWCSGWCSRRCSRRGGAGPAFLDVGLLRNLGCLVSLLVRSPFLLASLDGFLLGQAWRS